MFLTKPTTNNLAPQGLKPASVLAQDGTAEAVPFPNTLTARLTPVLPKHIYKIDSEYRAPRTVSDAGVPGIAGFWSRGAQTFAEIFQTVGDGEVSDEFHVFVT